MRHLWDYTWSTHEHWPCMVHIEDSWPSNRIVRWVTHNVFSFSVCHHNHHNIVLSLINIREAPFFKCVVSMGIARKGGVKACQDCLEHFFPSLPGGVKACQDGLEHFYVQPAHFKKWLPFNIITERRISITAVKALVWKNGTLLCKINFNRNISF